MWLKAEVPKKKKKILDLCHHMLWFRSESMYKQSTVSYFLNTEKQHVENWVISQNLMMLYTEAEYLLPYRFWREEPKGFSFHCICVIKTLLPPGLIMHKIK